MFAPAWQLLGRSSSLQKPGDYLCANLAGWPVFALVDENNELAAFQNVCSHQRMAVLENGTGNCPALRCRYHGWSYDLGGRFVSAPPLVAPAEAGSEANHLQRIAVEHWHALVFISVAGAGNSLAQLLATHEFGELPFCGDLTTDIGCNWKLYVEHSLAACEWVWPALIIRRDQDSAEVQQVIPRSFSRTRVIQYFFAMDDAAVECAKTRVSEAKTACEKAQKGAEQGVLPTADPLVSAFRARVREAALALG